MRIRPKEAERSFKPATLDNMIDLRYTGPDKTALLVGYPGFPRK